MDQRGRLRTLPEPDELEQKPDEEPRSWLRRKAGCGLSQAAGSVWGRKCSQGFGGLWQGDPGASVMTFTLFQINSELQVPPTQVFRVPTK